MGNILSIYLFLQYCFMTTLAMTAKNLTTDQSALLQFKEHVTSDPHSVLAYNWSISNPICSWVGISCGARHERVTALNVSFMDLGDTISPHLGNLSFLAKLDLGYNNFHGHLPNELGHLRRLRVFSVGNNRISGGIPGFIGLLSKLQILKLEYNNFSGTIPDVLFNVTMLEALWSRDNKIQGSISPKIAKLTRLKIFYMANNFLSGSIPWSSIYNSSSLQGFSLTNNYMSGSLPDDLCNCLPKLERLTLSFNRLSGQLPRSLGNCSEANTNSLSYNKFTGLIPQNIGNSSKITWFTLNNNNLEGDIPQGIGKLKNLQYFALGFNNLAVGLFPSSILNMSSLESIFLERSGLFGSLPADICIHIPTLEEINLEDNAISGNIPRTIKNCTSLSLLDLRDNVRGEIPEEIGNLQNLQVLYLDSNNLSGVIPASIFNISTIINISLSENYLSGYIPSTIGQGVLSLKSLALGSNEFIGTIPTSITNASKLTMLDLFFNSFSGPVPNIFGNLKFLEWLNLGFNNFTTESPSAEWSFLSSLTNCRKLKTLVLENNPLYGVIPRSISNLSATLEIFFASNCKIKGSIPTEVGNLHRLIILDLSENDLNGFIPTTIGNLQNLQGLWLNKNNFLGFIPYELCKLHMVDKLLLNDNMLSEPIPTCMANLTSLRDLQLGSNKLDSSIPPSLWTLQYILQVNLSSNSLSGILSPGIQSLKVLRNLDLSKNLLSGNILTTLGALQSLENLSLADNRFEGAIPNTFGALISLVFLDLSNNSLSGEIPKSLEAFTYLKNFNVSINNLHGEIPSKGPFKTFSARSFLLNRELCGLSRQGVPLCKVHTIKRSKTLIMKYILPSVLPVLMAMIVTFIFIRCYYQRRKHFLVDRVDSLPSATWRRTSYLEIQQATDGFSECNLLGIGSFGSVFKGILSEGTIVAIKVFNLQIERVIKSFDSECEVLRNIRHRNLIKVLSSCCNIDFKALILEFMPNGSLEKWLYSHNYFLDMLQRLNIMIDVASALEYLHHDYSTPVIHCDLKPHNILLDEDMVAHVSDFDIAKLLDERDSKTQTLTLATMGYMAPEYGSMGIVSTKGDIYSFGILLMETFTRKKPTDEIFTGEMSLKSLVEASLPDAVTDVVDANLLGEENGFAAKVNCLSSIIYLALNCSTESLERRINMKDALAKLKKIKLQFQQDIGPQ